MQVGATGLGRDCAKEIERGMRGGFVIVAVVVWLGVAGCPGRWPDPAPSVTAVSDADLTGKEAGTDLVRSPARERMVREQIEARGIGDPAVLAAMRRVPRHLFMPEQVRHLAYEDHPVPIGYGQTISQPYIVAFMSELARVEPGDRVLEIGTGSGYQAAILDALGAEVFSIEIVEPLARRAEQTLGELGHSNVRIRSGDGFAGWPEEAPFDRIVLTAAPPRIPQPLIDQLAPGGRLIAPEGRHDQELMVLTKGEQGVVRESVLPVRFVPMTGRAQTR